MDPEDRKLLIDTHRLAAENNKILRAMRRSAWIRTIVWMIVYAALILAPIWFYMTYLNGAVQSIIHSYEKMQNAGAQTNTEFQNAMHKIEGLFGGGSQGTPSQ